MHCSRRPFCMALWTLIGLGLAVPVAAEEAKAKVLKFTFTYQATVTGLKEGQEARIWLPVPSTSPEQEVKIDAKSLPEDAKMGRESTYGNRILYLERKAD